MTHRERQNIRTTPWSRNRPRDQERERRRVLFYAWPPRARNLRTSSTSHLRTTWLKSSKHWTKYRQLYSIMVVFCRFWQRQTSGGTEDSLVTNHSRCDWFCFFYGCKYKIAIRELKQLGACHSVCLCSASVSHCSVSTDSL